MQILGLSNSYVYHLSATGFLLFKGDALMKNGKVGSK